MPELLLSLFLLCHVRSSFLSLLSFHSLFSHFISSFFPDTLFLAPCPLILFLSSVHPPFYLTLLLSSTYSTHSLLSLNTLSLYIVTSGLLDYLCFLSYSSPFHSLT
ncbi:uncharacterized protein P884DRAFT_264832 [Thermothelomyces heterothallicus CBS 202.75]|uniref:uncharacterized protein n=1 Tax=Thermothelomyces heterothallicus CBS 202.75 TaxID=1149848 RepID=UPI00374493BA